MRRSLALGLLATTWLLGCGDSATDPAGAGAGAGAGGTGAGSATASTGGGDGCERGLVRCGEACHDLANEDGHCGACGDACGAGEVCLYRTCLPADMYCSDTGFAGTLCGEQCVLTSESLDHCGGCDSPCAAESYCSEANGGMCKPWQGDGTSCASPIVLAETGNFTVDFWFVAGSEALTLSCGALDPRPTVTFRWTSDTTDDAFKFKVYGNASDDVVLEVFSGAPCGPSTSLGCNNDETATKLTPELEMAVEAGKTYFIVVGSMAETPPPGRFALHVDD
jgi:hypothetical protein